MLTKRGDHPGRVHEEPYSMLIPVRIQTLFVGCIVASLAYPLCTPAVTSAFPPGYHFECKMALEKGLGLFLKRNVFRICDVNFYPVRDGAAARIHINELDKPI
jgi:hypothetical protein